jgi:hypothetical protein
VKDSFRKREREREREREGLEGGVWSRGGFIWLLATVLPKAWKSLMVNGFYEVKRGCIFLLYNPSMTGLVGFGF